MPGKRKYALAALMTGAAAAAVTAGVFVQREVSRRRPFIIEEASIDAMQQAMKRGQTSSKALVQAYLDRIEKIDRSGPKINAFIEVNPEALREAEACDVKRSVTPDVGPLFGIPLVLKDNINTAGRMHTTAGSVALAGHMAGKDAFIVRQLKRAGAVVIGKANLTEFANFMAENMPNGFSSLGGQVVNPYGAAFDVGGSSSGTAAAVAANLAAAGIGTETSASIISPASANSLVGIKPTVGVASRNGIVPIAHSQDTPGPIARSVRDAVLVLNAITGVDDEDEETFWSRSDVPNDYTAFLKRNGLHAARVGIDRHYLKALNAEKQSIINRALEIMEEKGATVVDPAAIPSTEALEHRESSVMYREFKWDLNHYLKSVPEEVPVHSLADVIAFNRMHSEVALRYGQTVLEKAERMSEDLSEKHYLIDRADDLRLSRKEGIDAAMKAHRLDALVFANQCGSALAAMAGYPAITVPAGYTGEGEPVGVTFVGGAFSEPRLIELAYSFEQATKFRVPPAF